MHKKGIIRNEDLAIIIGSNHDIDFSEIYEQAEKGSFSYNIVKIVPKGTKKEIN